MTIIISSACDSRYDTITITMKRLDWWSIFYGDNTERQALVNCIMEHEEEGLVDMKKKV